MKHKISPAQMDAIVNSKGFGDVARRLLANGLDFNSLRENATTLSDREWELYDKAIIDVARPVLVGVNDLRARGLVYNLDGMSSTVLTWETISSFENAQMGMDPGAAGRNDQLNFVPNYLPLVITYNGFQIDIRSLNMSRKAGTGLELSHAEAASFTVAEKIENTLFNGASLYKFRGAMVYGYCDFPDRNTVSLGTQWDDSAATGAIIVSKVLEMIQASVDDNCPGPWGLYVPQGYAFKLGEDYKAATSTTIGQRIADIENLEFVKVAPKLTAHNVVLVQLSKNTVEEVIGLDITNVPWEGPGGFYLHHKILAIMLPRLKSDQDGRCGIVHAS